MFSSKKAQNKCGCDTSHHLASCQFSNPSSVALTTGASQPQILPHAHGQNDDIFKIFENNLEFIKFQQGKLELYRAGCELLASARREEAESPHVLYHQPAAMIQVANDLLLDNLNHEHYARLEKFIPQYSHKDAIAGAIMTFIGIAACIACFVILPSLFGIAALAYLLVLGGTGCMAVGVGLAMVTENLDSTTDHVKRYPKCQPTINFYNAAAVSGSHTLYGKRKNVTETAVGFDQKPALTANN